MFLLFRLLCYTIDADIGSIPFYSILFYHTLFYIMSDIMLFYANQ